MNVAWLSGVSIVLSAMLPSGTSTQPGVDHAPYGCGHLCVYVISSLLGESRDWIGVRRAFEGHGGVSGELSFMDIAEVTSSRMGWYSRAMKLDARQISALPCPAIAAVHPQATDSKPHFVVLAPLTPGTVQVYDPPNAPLIAAPTELFNMPNLDFHGEVLLLDSRPVISAPEDRLLGCLRLHWGMAIAGCAALWVMVLAAYRAWRGWSSRMAASLTALAYGTTAALAYLGAWAWLRIG